MGYKKHYISNCSAIDLSLCVMTFNIFLKTNEQSYHFFSYGKQKKKLKRFQSDDVFTAVVKDTVNFQTSMPIPSSPSLVKSGGLPEAAII